MKYTKNIQATTRSADPYVDSYTGFTWNNIHSATFNCFIENTGHLDFHPAPSFSNNFVTPTFQERTYYTGMQQQTKQFQLNLVFYQLTLADLNSALRWLDRSVISDFFFDYEPYWKYSCKLSAIGTMEKYVNGRTFINNKPYDLYLCRVPVTFETVYQTDAVSAYTVFKWKQINEDLPEGWASNLVNGYTNNQYFDTLIDDADNLITIDEPMNQSMRIHIYNPANRPLYFKLHFYNVASNARVYIVQTVDESGADYRSDDVLTLIMQTTLNLDAGHTVHLHYNSEDGTVTTAQALVADLRGIDGHNICEYSVSQANINVPPFKTLMLQLDNIVDTNMDAVAVEFNLKNYMI